MSSLYSYTFFLVKLEEKKGGVKLYVQSSVPRIIHDAGYYT
jgi:hypothetical protein